MRYKIPIDSREEEKAIGGVLTFKQFGWIAGGVGVGVLFFTGAYSLFNNSIVAGLLFAIIPIGGALPFAFVKLHDMSLITYIKTKKAFENKSSKLFNDKGGY